MPRPKEATRVILCLFSVLFLGVADNQILSPILPEIRLRFGSSSLEMGLLYTVYSAAAAVSVLVWGPFADVFGPKLGLLTGLVGFAAGSAISYAAPSFQALLAGRIATGVGASLLSLNAITYAGHYFPYAVRGWAMSSIFSSYFAALILGVPVASVVAGRLGWNAVFACTGATALVLLASSTTLLPALARDPTAPARGWLAVRHFRSYAGFFREPATVAVLGSALAASAGMVGFLAFVGVWLRDDFGIGVEKAGLVFLASGAAALAVSPLAGKLSDRVGKRAQFLASSLALALLIAVLPRFGWGAPLFALFGAVSLAAAFRQGPMEALVTEIVPGGVRGSFVALRNGFSQIGIGAAALASGQLFEVGGYGAVCLLSAVLNLAAAAGILLLGREREL